LFSTLRGAEQLPKTGHAIGCRVQGSEVGLYEVSTLRVLIDLLLLIVYAVNNCMPNILAAACASVMKQRAGRQNAAKEQCQRALPYP
jgi:hypothetical protein